MNIKKIRPLGLVLVGMLLLSACAPAAVQVAPTAPPVAPTVGRAPTSAPAQVNTPVVILATPVIPNTGSTNPTAGQEDSGYGKSKGADDTPAPDMSGAQVNVGETASLGKFLVDAKGMTLYLFTKDTPGVSNCKGKCLVAWPPLFTDGAPVAGKGVDASKLGSITLADGKKQVTYDQMPLYYYKDDVKPGDVTGQDVGQVWYVVDPVSGKAIEEAKSSNPAPAASGAVVNVGQDATLGKFLVDAKGMTLYLFTKDTPGVSNCKGGCLTAWPPLFTDGAPVAGSGVDASKLGSITLADGKKQVTYNQMPLYYYQKDQKPGDVTGQNVGQVWFVVAP